MIQLRDYQNATIAAVEEAYRAGVHRQAVQLPTGAGKTVVFSALLQQRGGRSLILAHRDELLQQAQQKLHMVAPELGSGIVKAQRQETGMQVTIASMQTLVRPARLEAFPRDFDQVIVDECFPAGTLVSGVPIETLVEGDRVHAFNPQDGAVELCLVSAVMTRPAPDRLYRVFVGDATVVATANHPFYTKRGWMGASSITSLDEVLMYGTVLQNLRRPGPGQERRSMAGNMFAGVSAEVELYNDGANQPAVCVATDEGTQPDGPARNQAGGQRLTTGDGPQATAAGRQRPRADGAASATPGSVGPGLDSGVGRPVWTAEGERLADALQARFGVAGNAGHGRGGRRFTRIAGAEGVGRAQDSVLAWSRVERVEVLEPGSDGRFGGVCPDGRVYNIEVDGLHTYIANGFVVHNCHHAAAEGYQRILEHVVGPETLLLGVSATLQRGDHARLDDVFDQVTYSVDMIDLMQQGYLCDLRALEIKLDINLKGLHRRGGDYVDSELAERLEEANAPEHAVEAYQKHADGRKALLFSAATVQSARSFMDAFKAAGIPADMVYGAMKPAERTESLRRYHTGETKVLCNCMVLTEGFDEPSTDCVIMARPTTSKSLYIQMLGRGTRTHPGKDDCLVLDLAGAASRIGDLMSVATLFGVEPQTKPEGMQTVLEGVGVAKEKAEAVAQAGELVAREVQLFKRRDLAWGVGDQRYTLSAGPQGLLVLKKDEDDLFGDSYDVVRVYREQGPYDRYPRDAVEVLAQGYDLGYAQGLAEEYVRQHGVKAFVNPNASWRGKPASEAQLKFAKRLGVKYGPDVTMGEISELIDQAKARKV